MESGRLPTYEPVERYYPPPVSRLRKPTSSLLLCSACLNSVFLHSVMGNTGTGKSSFINLVSGSNLRVSDHLESCTQNIDIGNDFELDGRLVQLLDTPGFDDTHKSEAEIFMHIAVFLEHQYRNGTTLHGVIYLHRISDLRMGGVSTQSLVLFGKMCGDEAFKNVVFATSMWDKVTLEEGENRERQLVTDKEFFKTGLDNHAKVFRYDNTLGSAHRILRAIFENQPRPLLIQRELVDYGLPIRDTAAGREVRRASYELEQRCLRDVECLKQEIAQALKDRDVRGKEELAGELREGEILLARIEREMSDLASEFSHRKALQQIKDSVELGRTRRGRFGWRSTTVPTVAKLVRYENVGKMAVWAGAAGFP
ncbi:GTP-binding protein A [Hypsizygus marmoreus]|uniref:GTP-binding protein A n=1 Tax=Hypsizygus marmoreus TaxID=39966 RepID=A0A369KBC0_HYPMA|nr:GTP-binding protein A [Hypsizygus marmoreus]